MKHFKIVTFPTVLHQIDPDLRQETIELGQQYVDPNDGYLLIQDFAMTFLADPSQPRFFNNWHRDWGTYRLLLADPREDFKKLHEIAIFDGGRAKKMIFGRDIGKIALVKDLDAILWREIESYNKNLQRGEEELNAAAYLQRMRELALHF